MKDPDKHAPRYITHGSQRGVPQENYRRLSTPISKHLRSVESWRTCLPEMRDGFRAVMRNRAYGKPETIDAWHWFYCGWFKAGRATHSIDKPREAMRAINFEVNA
jgi:hypothetical protein